MSRLRDRYSKDVAPALKKEFGYKNVMAIPRIDKVVVNMGLGEATQNAKIVDTGADEVMRITGQKPVVTRAKKSIAQFKVRKGQPIGIPCRTLNWAIDFLARRTAAFWPVILPISSAPVSAILAFDVASPSPMLMTIFLILGIAITFL